MDTRTWLRRSLRHHWHLHLALAGGAALSATVLTAALLTGDTLNRSLRRLALERVGRARSAIELTGRLTDASLAPRLAHATGRTVAGLLRLPASVLAIGSDGNETHVDDVTACGVDAGFFALAPAPANWDFSGGAVLPSERVAQALGSAAGEAAFSLRVQQPSTFPLEMPLIDRRSDRLVRRNVQWPRSIPCLPDAAFGRFSLEASQIPPLNLFADRTWLAGMAGVSNRVNLLLSDAEPDALEQALRACLMPEDAGMQMRQATGGVWLVESDRIFMDEAYARALDLTNAVLTLHHLVDSFSAGEGADLRETPYGFISALSPTADPRLGVVPAGMADDELVINAWLARKLKLAVGDRVTLRWRRFESGGKLAPDAAVFRVARVLDMTALASECAWLPRFPGLTDVNRCVDWDIGLPMEQAKLKDADNEAYWNRYGPAPKAFVTLAAGRLMMGTLFGSAMTARFPPEADPDDIRSRLRQVVPARLGLAVRPVREEALRAVEQAMDFRQLFVGMSLVLMASALILTGLIASLGVARRREEVGVLRAAGFTGRQVAFLWLAETLPPLLAGVACGVAAGVGGAALLVQALNKGWSGAVAAARIDFIPGWRAGLIAGSLALAASLLAVRAGVRRALNTQVRELLGDQPEEPMETGGRRWAAWNSTIGMGAAGGAIALLLTARQSADRGGIFFGAGFLLMISLLCFARLVVHFLATAACRSAAGPGRSGMLNVARHRRRSLLVMVLLSTGCFLTVGTLAMKDDPAADVARPSSGSGGFSWMIACSMPPPGTQGDDVIRGALGSAANVLPMRVHAGEEAGCLNLNHAVQPRLLGISPATANAAGAFAAPSEWALLEQPMPDGTIPALAGDRTTVEYGLKAKADPHEGTIYRYRGEDGLEWKLRLVGSLPVRTGVLQGSLIVDEAMFTRMFPSAGGHALWLARSGNADAADAVRRALGRHGGVATPTAERLRQLAAVESTYLDMFLVLGGLGVILGAAGVGLVMLRDAAARRRELALLRAIGVSRARVIVYLLAEHAFVLLGGLAAGVIPALVAVQPAVQGLGQRMPLWTMASVIAGMFAVGIVGILAAVAAASRAPLSDALRGE